jgi:hypothetical protein
MNTLVGSQIFSGNSSMAHISQDAKVSKNRSVSLDGISGSRWLKNTAIAVGVLGAITPIALFGHGRITNPGPGGANGITSLLGGLMPGAKSNVTKGSLPNTYNGPAIDFRYAEKRAADFYDEKKFEAISGVRTPWLAKLPLNHAHYKNGFLDLLKDGDRKLTTSEIEAARDAVQAFIKHDSRCDLKTIRGDLSGVPESKWGEHVAKVVFETSQDALAYVGISNPSKELSQLAYSMACNSFTNRNGIYDEAHGSQITRVIKKWPTLNEWIQDSRGVCSQFSGATVNLIRAGASSINDLSGIEAANTTGSLIDSGQVRQGLYHSVTTFRINSKFVFISDGTLPVNAPLSAGELSIATNQFVSDFDPKAKKYFHAEHVGGDLPGVFLDLGNANKRYYPSNLINLYKEDRQEYLDVRRNQITHFTDFENWHKSNSQVLPQLHKILFSYRQNL